MRNLTGWPTDTDALEPLYRVEHGGQAREVNALSLKRTLPSSHHAQVVGVGGITQATGQVTWASRADATTSHATAFNRSDNWPPRVRDRVNVYTGYRTLTGDKLARQLAGTISGSSGDPMSDTLSGLVDVIARLSRKVNLPPLLNNMPPLNYGGAWRGVGLYPTFFTDKAARAGGFNSTPPMVSGSVFSAPLMGSAWPERGILHTGLRFTDRNNANAVWQETPWGMGVSDAYLTYAPLANAGLAGGAMEITAMAVLPFAARSYVAARWGATEIRLNFNNGGGVYGMVNGTVVCEMQATDSGVFSLRVTRSGGNVVLTLRDPAGREATGTTGAPAGVDGTLGEVWVVAESSAAIIGGAQVAFPSTPWQSVGYTRSAFITPAAHNASLAASPPIQDVPAKDLLDEQSTAELAALWIDGDGFLRWVNRDRLVAGAPVTTLTSKDHLKSLAWEEDFTAVSYSVEVTGRRAEAIMQSKTPRHELWQGNYGDVKADGTEVFEELLHPDADEDWIMVDTSFNNTTADTNRLEGSDVSLYFFFEKNGTGETGDSNIEGHERQWAGASLTQIDHRTYKLVTQVYKVTPSGYDEWEFALKIPTERQGSAGGWPAGLGGMGFPVIRSYAKVGWSDSRATALTGATMDAPTLTHDVGWWVQDAGACQAIANLLAAQTRTPRPFLSGVSIVPDARLERGDIVTLTDPDVTGVEFRCLIVGIEDSFTSSPIRWSQSLDLRVLDYFTTTTTLSELDAAWAGQLLAALDAARAEDSLAQFDVNPLKGAPQ